MAPSIRRGVRAFLSAALVAAHIFMAWKAAALVTGCRSPIVVVTSESMEPAFQRGDVLLLWNRQGHIRVGDVAVVGFPTRKLPMVSIFRPQSAARIVPSCFPANERNLGPSCGAVLLPPP